MIVVSRTTVNLVTDLAVALLMLGMLATGYVLRFPLPPGTNKGLELWGLTRHEWGTVHFGLSAGLLGLVLFHLVLHWPWLVCTVSKRLHLRVAPGGRHLRSGLLAGAFLAAGFAAFAWAAHRAVEPITGPREGVCPPGAEGSGQETLQSPGAAADSSPPDVPSAVSFRKDVYPILERACLSCHGPDRQSGGFRVDRREDFFRPAGTGPLVLRGRSSESPLIAIVSGARHDLPRPDRHRLSASEVLVLKKWIDAGAPED